MTARRSDNALRGVVFGLLLSIPVYLVVGAAVLLSVTSTQGAPNEQTQLPAGGVTSITRDGDSWTVTTTGPASEIKYMEPGPQQIVCGTNNGNPCTTVETFTVDGDCVYLQLDGIPGENSFDPYVCRGGTPSTPSPVATEPVPTSPAPTPTTTTPATSEPSPSPTPSETTSPTSTPEPSKSPSASPQPSGTPAPVGTDSRILTGSPSTDSTPPAPARLADTGTDIGGVIFWAALAVLSIAVGVITGRRDGLERFGSES